MVFIYLLLGHLIGDFVLQTNQIARYKQESARWVLVHVILVTTSIILFSFPFGMVLLSCVVINGLLHFVIDFYKPQLEKVFNLGTGGYFFLDQIIHVLILYLVSLTAVQNPKLQSLDRELTGLLLAIVFVTSYSAVQNQFILSSLFPKVKKMFFETGEKSIGNILRLLNFVILYFAFKYNPWLLLGLFISLYIMWWRFKKDWKDWAVKGYFITKYSLDLLVSCIALGITYWIY